MNFAILDAPMAKQIKSLNGKNKDLQAEEQFELYRQFAVLKEAVRAEYRRIKEIDFVSQATLGIETVAYKMTKIAYDPIKKEVIPPRPILDKKGNPIPIKRRTQKTELSSSYQKNDITEDIVNGAIEKELDPVKKKQLIIGKKAHEKLLRYPSGMVVTQCNSKANIEKANPFWTSELVNELHQECYKALAYCIWHYQPISPLTGVPIKFSSYAYGWIDLAIRDFMKTSNLSGLTESDDAKIRFYTDVKDSEGNYTSIYEVNNLATSENTIDYLVEQEENQLNLQKYRVVKRVLTPQELESLMEDDKPSVNIFEETMFEGLASVSPDSKRQKILDKVRQILD